MLDVLLAGKVVRVDGGDRFRNMLNVPLFFSSSVLQYLD